MTDAAATPMTREDEAYHRARWPAEMVDRLIANGTFVIVEKGSVAHESNSNKN